MVTVMTGFFSFLGGLWSRSIRFDQRRGFGDPCVGGVPGTSDEATEETLWDCWRDLLVRCGEENEALRDCEPSKDR